MSGHKIIEGLKEVVAGNFSRVTIDGQVWVKRDPAETSVEEWIAYADKLEAALKLACGQTSDRLMRMHAEQGLRVVRPAHGS